MRALRKGATTTNSLVVGMAGLLLHAAMLADRGSTAHLVPSFGVNVHFTGSTALPGEIAMLSAAFRIARMDFHWAMIEQQEGIYNFSEYDKLLQELTAHNVRPYWIFDYGNTLYQDSLSPSDPESVSAFARFVSSSIVHFAGNDIIWEIWNGKQIYEFCINNWSCVSSCLQQSPMATSGSPHPTPVHMQLCCIVFARQ